MTTTTTTTTTTSSSVDERVFCVECEDVEAAMRCPECGGDAYCGLCYKYLHRKGARQHHHPIPLPGVDIHQHLQPCRGTTDAFTAEFKAQQKESRKKLSAEEKRKMFSEALEVDGDESTQYNTEEIKVPTPKPKEEEKEDDEKMRDDGDKKEESEGEEDKAAEARPKKKAYSDSSSSSSDDFSSSSDEEANKNSVLYSKSRASASFWGSSFDEGVDYYGDAGGDEIFATWVPMRLLPEERELLQTLEGVMDVSEYTDKVDVSFDYFGWRTGGNRKLEIISEELQEVLHLVLGMCVSGNYTKGRKLLEKELAENEEFFQTVFEIGRRYKVMNPDKMRTTYGKLIHMMMDFVENHVMGVENARPILTVRRFLESKCVGGAQAALAMLRDDRMKDATDVVVVQEQDRVSSEEVAARIQRKKEAREALVKQYGAGIAVTGLTEGDVERVLESLEDANNYLRGNRDPVQRMLDYLQEYFTPDEPSPELMEETRNCASLELIYGRGGSCLSHSHATQYEFVRQTLMLWREIQSQMFKLWIMADRDLLSTSTHYRLANTGQGLNRMKSAPCVSRAMSQILSRVQGTVRRGWVGLSVVHLGDYDVPNALFFIDKYTQVPRILGPLVHAIDRIDVLDSDPRVSLLIKICGGREHCKRFILSDYFRHGFDGSGSDGGSCVDGRLTSSWNWCSLVEKKVYYPLLLATGFDGFDGSFS